MIWKNNAASNFKELRIYETHISAEQSKKDKKTRISQKNVYPWRKTGNQCKKG